MPIVAVEEPEGRSIHSWSGVYFFARAANGGEESVVGEGKRRGIGASPAEVIEKGREIWALTPRKETLGLVAVASERRKVDLAIDAIVKEDLVCNKLRCKAQNEQHNSKRELSAVTKWFAKILGEIGARCGKGSRAAILSRDKMEICCPSSEAQLQSPRPETHTAGRELYVFQPFTNTHHALRAHWCSTHPLSFPLAPNNEN